MTRKPVFCAGRTPALQYAREFIRDAGFPVAGKAGWDAGHLLLDIPSFRPGLWTEEERDTLLSSLPRDIILWGGDLSWARREGFRTRDLLLEEDYLRENARITAACTLPMVQAHRKEPCPVLIIGWGRIGKALGELLTEKGYAVTVASRSSRNLIEACGHRAVDTAQLSALAPEYPCIVNTAPAPVLSREDTALCRDCLKIDLASRRGIAGDDVRWERALPGRLAPEQSGRLIADTFLRLEKEENP